MTRKQKIKALTEYGFSPVKALEIAIDTERNDEHALKFLKLAVDHRKTCV